MSNAADWLTRPILILALLSGWPLAAMPLTYSITPSSTDIAFAVDILGVATAQGAFSRFTGSLTVDPDHPELNAVTVRIDASSASIGWEPAASLVTGESYLDVAHYPEVLFVSRQVTALGANKVRLDGELTLHGVSHPESFVADLVGRHWNAQKTTEEADFAAVGTVKRSDYAMDPEDSMLDDHVTFTIHARLSLGNAGITSVLVP